MKQILNGFLDCYYLTKDGKVYIDNKDKYIECNKQHNFILKTEDNKNRKISLKTLYRLVYNDTFCIDNISNLEGEQWLPIEGSNNNYWCSNAGRLKSYTGYEARLLKPYTTKGGYLRADIYIDGHREARLVQRIVAALWLLPPKSIDCQLHHLNQIKTDNRSCNLKWLTPKEHRAAHIALKQKEIAKDVKID